MLLPLYRGFFWAVLNLQTVLTPLHLETHFFTNLLEISAGRDFGARKGFTPNTLRVNAFTTGRPVGNKFT